MIYIRDINFYLNGSNHTKILVEPLGIDYIAPSKVAIFNLTDFSTGNYTIRVTGPFGISREVFDELNDSL